MWNQAGKWLQDRAQEVAAKAQEVAAKAEEVGFWVLLVLAGWGVYVCRGGRDSSPNRSMLTLLESIMRATATVACVNLCM